MPVRSRGAKSVKLPPRPRRVLLVLFVPSVQRDGHTPTDQSVWTDATLELLGRLYGGATAYPRARGVWRDDERGGTLVYDDPVIVQCYAAPRDVEDIAKFKEVAAFCLRMCRDAGQGEVAIVIDDVFIRYNADGEVL